MTRAGTNSRVIITGDPTQIDNPILNVSDNGLVRAVHKFRGHALCASIYLPRSERSEIAEVAATRLGSQMEVDFWHE